MRITTAPDAPGRGRRDHATWSLSRPAASVSETAPAATRGSATDAPLDALVGTGEDVRLATIGDRARRAAFARALGDDVVTSGLARRGPLEPYRRFIVPAAWAVVLLALLTVPLGGLTILGLRLVWVGLGVFVVSLAAVRLLGGYRTTPAGERAAGEIIAFARHLADGAPEAPTARDEARSFVEALPWAVATGTSLPWLQATLRRVEDLEGDADAAEAWAAELRRVVPAPDDVDGASRLSAHVRRVGNLVVELEESAGDAR